MRIAIVTVLTVFGISIFINTRSVFICEIPFLNYSSTYSLFYVYLGVFFFSNLIINKLNIISTIKGLLIPINIKYILLIPLILILSLSPELFIDSSINSSVIIYSILISLFAGYVYSLKIKKVDYYNRKSIILVLLYISLIVAISWVVLTIFKENLPSNLNVCFSELTNLNNFIFDF